MRRTLLTFAALAAVAGLTGCTGTEPAASPSPADAPTSSTPPSLLTVEPEPEPVARDRAVVLEPVSVAPVAGATVTPAPAGAPERPAPVEVIVDPAPAPVDTPAPVAVEVPVQPAPVVEPAPVVVVDEPVVAEQLPDETIGSYRCDDATLVVVEVVDGSTVCGEVAP
jgi:hypothetical protein